MSLPNTRTRLFTSKNTSISLAQSRSCICIFIISTTPECLLDSSPHQPQHSVFRKIILKIAFLMFETCGLVFLVNLWGVSQSARIHALRLLWMITPVGQTYGKVPKFEFQYLSTSHSGKILRIRLPIGSHPIARVSHLHRCPGLVPPK